MNVKDKLITFKFITNLHKEPQKHKNEEVFKTYIKNILKSFPLREKTLIETTSSENPVKIKNEVKEFISNENIKLLKDSLTGREPFVNYTVDKKSESVATVLAKLHKKINLAANNVEKQTSSFNKSFLVTKLETKNLKN